MQNLVLIVVGFVGGLLFANISGFDVTRSLNPVPEIVSRQATVADLIIAAFDHDPSGWSGTHYRANYRDGSEVWIANSDRGLTVDNRGGHYVPSDDDKKRIWEAYQRWSAKVIVGK